MLNPKAASPELVALYKRSFSYAAAVCGYSRFKIICTHPTFVSAFTQAEPFGFLRDNSLAFNHSPESKSG
jgi:hypothetical protein